MVLKILTSIQNEKLELRSEVSSVRDENREVRSIIVNLELNTSTSTSSVNPTSNPVNLTPVSKMWSKAQ